MAISATGSASATLCTASANKITQTCTLNGLSFVFCSKSRKARRSKKGGARVGANTKSTLNLRTKSVTMQTTIWLLSFGNEGGVAKIC